MTAVAVAENPRAVAGGNNPPEPTPYEIAAAKVNDIYGEAALWLDGTVVENQETADGIANLLAELRKARKLAEETRKAEKEPHDKLAAEVQARFKPLLEKADLAAEACKRAVAPWLQKLAAEQERVARLARDEADRKQREAEDAIRATDAANLAERAAAEALVKDAKKANVVANKAERVTATAGGAFGKATGLRTVWIAILADAGAALMHYATHAEQETQAFL